MVEDLESLAKCAKKSHIYNALQDSVFKSLAKFILSIFDTEDLERFNFYNRIVSENKKFYREKLLPLPLEDCDDPAKLIAEGKITLDGFPLLTEYDMGFLIEEYKSNFIAHIRKWTPAVVVEFMNFVTDEIEGCCFKKGRHKRYLEMARTVMLQFAPLKEEIKMHTIMENGLSPCYCITDALRYEALSDIGILDIKNHLTSADLEDMLEEVAWRTNCSMLSLSGGRYDSVRLLYVGVTHALMFGPFGSFADEVIDLVKIAEARRRYEGHRYISRHHILWAVGLTGVKGFVEKLINGLGLQNLVEEPAAYPPYNIYMSARTIANILGDEIVGVEHLVVAIAFEVNQRSLNGKGDVSPPLVADGSAWNKFGSKKCVQEFLNAVKRYKKKAGRKLIKLPTKIVQWRAPETKLLDQLRRVEKDMKYGWHEFASLRCKSP
ncbi:uncharacterized protein LOC111277623 [Durio zibethinus]|uniref:Uncharacterized protein LOC111277623 n=1 Tax=Durio zibethinus TaxID=66656 RepID=A0A6P5WUE7_DURZI|nr:uncharacterized protein LOC111277623 [Durio zibethinus]